MVMPSLQTSNKLNNFILKRTFHLSLLIQIGIITLGQRADLKEGRRQRNVLLKLPMQFWMIGRRSKIMRSKSKPRIPSPLQPTAPILIPSTSRMQ
jgi:hypothetical protein